MITRIVQLTFKEVHLKEFLDHFEQVKHQVNDFPGCHGMRLHQSTDNPCQVLTYSLWQNSEALETYRKSELFGTIWPVIKRWFNAPPQAWSTATVFDGFNQTSHKIEG